VAEYKETFIAMSPAKQEKAVKKYDLENRDPKEYAENVFKDETRFQIYF